MEIIRKENYIAVISNKKMDRNGNPKYNLNIFQENENGEYFERAETKISSYNIKKDVEYILEQYVLGV